VFVIVRPYHLFLEKIFFFFAQQKLKENKGESNEEKAKADSVAEKRASMPSNSRVQKHTQSQLNDDLSYADEATFYASFNNESTNDDSDLQLTPCNEIIRSSLLTQGTLFHLSNTTDLDDNTSQNDVTPTLEDHELHGLDSLSRAKILINK
jgi:hypothetical protein